MIIDAIAISEVRDKNINRNFSREDDANYTRRNTATVHTYYKVNAYLGNQEKTDGKYYHILIMNDLFLFIRAVEKEEIEKEKKHKQSYYVYKLSLAILCFRVL